MAAPEWRPVVSDWITDEAYDPDTEAILVRFHNGREWSYEACPPEVWAAFTAPGQSRGKFFHAVLKDKPNHQHVS